MPPLSPRADLPTHSVENMPGHMGDQQLWSDDRALQDAVQAHGGGWAADRLNAFGQTMGKAEMLEAADQANRFPPELKSFDRYGMRVDQAVFHPGYHTLMDVAISNEVHSFEWNHTGPGAHVAHGALTYMHQQVEGGVMCPMAMAYSAFPSLTTTPAIADEWLPRLLSTEYDARDIPVE